jgi:methionyl aminopeptidase
VVEIKTKSEIEAIRAAGHVVAEALTSVRAQATAGIPMTELDDVARSVLTRAGAPHRSSAINRHSHPCRFPAVICVSLNDAALPAFDSRRLETGDLVSADFRAPLDGRLPTRDAFTVGPPSRDDERLLGGSRAPGRGRGGRGSNRIRGHLGAIGAIGRASGYGLNTDFGGHGVGRSMQRTIGAERGPPGRGMRQPWPGDGDRAVVHGRWQRQVPDR